jgi:hypothetical protein
MGGDLVEDHSPQGRLVQVGRLHQVPGDGFALAVGVGSQEDHLRSLAGGGYLAHHPPFLLGNDVEGVEAVLDIHPQSRLGQVAHVTNGGLHLVLTAEDVAHGASLGGRFHHHQALAASLCHRGHVP